MKQVPLAIASILKPIDDPRMYEKFGGSLKEIAGPDLHIIGFKTKKKLEDPHISFHPLFGFNRKEYGRLNASFIYFKKLLKVKPKVTIVNTPELLIVTILYKILFGTEILYDILENYAINVRFTSTYPALLRPFIAGAVRLTEWISRPFITHYFLAEETYAKELPFLPPSGYTLLENKFVPDQNTFRPNSCPVTYTMQKTYPLKMVYTGTIAVNYGIREAIHLADELHKHGCNITLTICGYAPEKSVYYETEKASRIRPYVFFYGSLLPVPHTDILNLMQEADFGLLPYHPNPGTHNCKPTKLFEYMGHGLPMIIQHNPLWERVCTPHQAAIFIDYHSPDTGNIIEEIRSTRFYPNGIPDEAFWKNAEDQKLKQVIKDLLNKSI